MAVWVLEPKTKGGLRLHESWRGSRDDLVRVVVVADTESDARGAAADSMLVGAKTYDKITPPSDRTTLSPWRDHGASSCTSAEFLADKSRDPIIAIEPHGLR